MGQFLDYIASVFTTSRSEPIKEKTSSHVTFADNSFTQAFTRGETEKAAKIESVKQSNRKTIYTYQFIGAISFLAHLSMVTVPRIQLEEFNILQPGGWQLVTLSLVPVFVYLSSVSAMNEINRPLNEGAKLSSKNSGLDLNNNEFIQSLKIIILLMSICQILSIYFDHLLWTVVMIVPFWCYQLTSRIANSEYKRFAPSPKKQWVKLNVTKSPNKLQSTPNKKLESSASKNDNAQTRATPRTRTKRAVRNIMAGVSDKYHAFEQNVAHQITTKIFTPLSPSMKMIEKP